MGYQYYKLEVNSSGVLISMLKVDGLKAGLCRCVVSVDKKLSKLSRAWFVIFNIGT